MNVRMDGFGRAYQVLTAHAVSSYARFRLNVRCSGWFHAVHVMLVKVSSSLKGLPLNRTFKMWVVVMIFMMKAHVIVLRFTSKDPSRRH